MSVQLLSLLLIASQPTPVDLDDLSRFPSRVLARQKYNNLVSDRPIVPHPAFHPTRDDLERYAYQANRLRAWDLLTDAHRSEMGRDFQLMNLRALRKFLGAEAYYYGWMPE